MVGVEQILNRAPPRCRKSATIATMLIGVLIGWFGLHVVAGAWIPFVDRMFSVSPLSGSIAVFLAFAAAVIVPAAVAGFGVAVFIGAASYYLRLSRGTL